MSSCYDSWRDFKAGSTFAQVGTAALPPGLWSASCQLRHFDTHELIAPLEIALGTSVDGLTPFTLSADSSVTRSWNSGPIARLFVFDFRFVDQDGNSLNSQTKGLRVLRAITEPTA